MDDPFAHHVITRKRKKYKFAHFDAFTNSFSHLRGDDPQKTYETVESYLPGTSEVRRPLTIELAAGNAQFSFWLAKQYPEQNFIAIDIKSDRLYTSAKQALAEGVENIAFVRMSIQEFARVFPNRSVDTIWLTFPDPFARKRSIRRRLTHPLFLKQYREVLAETGSLHFKTDNRDLFLWSLEQFVAEKWHLSELSFDLHESDLPKDYKIKTHYEQKFTLEGVPTNFCSIIKQ